MWKEGQIIFSETNTNILVIMGNNSKKKVHSLPPLGKDSKSRGRKRTDGGGLDVHVPDRQRLIGSPAPQSMRRISEKHNRAFKKVVEY